MDVTTTFDGRQVGVRYSSGSQVPYLERWEDNVLHPRGGADWPPALLKQVNGYVARRSWFSDEDADALAVRLGRISKFQSIRSEDALTWSWFGTLSCAGPPARQAVTQWLYARLGLQLTASADPAVDQWMRVAHPNAPQSPNGPELDARVDDPQVALIYVEAKWEAAIGTGKGASEGVFDDQVVLRRDSMRADPALANDHRNFVVLGVSRQGPDLSLYVETEQDPPLRRVTVAWLTWQDLAACEAHPLAPEFRAYLEWKQTHASDSA